MKILIMALASVFSFFAANAGNVFYWRSQHVKDHTAIGGALPEFFEWASFDDPANWSLSRSEYANQQNLIPGAQDSLYMLGYMQSSAGSSWTMGYFDLNGKSWTVAGYSTNGCPTGTFLYKKNIMGLTNGTLTVSNPNYIQKVSHSYRIYSGATLVYPPGVKITVSTANPYEDWIVKNGGRVEVGCGLSLIYLMCDIEPGGSFLWNPESFDLSAAIVDGMGSSITNRGEFYAPNGILWNGSDKSGSTAKVKTFEFVQKDGTVTLGGDFTKTTEESYIGGVMRFVLGGGKLVAEKNVAFKNSVSKWGDEVAASMPDGASATVEVSEGATLDMSLFTYGDGTSLAKTGPGTLVLAEMPDSLSVSAGKIRFMNTITASVGFSAASGSEVVFAAANNELEAFEGCKDVSYALEEGKFAIGSVVLRSDDEEFLRHVASSIASSVPEDAVAVVSGGVLCLAAKVGFQFSADGSASLSDPSAWGGAVPAGEDIFVLGGNTVAKFDATTPVFKSITVAGGATLEVSGNGSVLPQVNLKYPSRILFVKDSVTEFSVDRLFSDGNADGLPVFEIATNATVTVPDGTKFKNIHFKLFGQIGVPDVGTEKSIQGITFGSASAGETAYFSMTAIGGRIRMTGTAGTARRFMCPENGGSVCPVGELLLKDVTFPPYPETPVRLGVDVGTYNNNTPFELVLDNTIMPLSQTSRIYQHAHVICRNGGMLKSVYRHPGVANGIQLRQYSKLTMDGSGSGLYYPYSDKLTMQIDSYVANSDVIELKNGGWIATHNIIANETSHKATLAVSNGTWRIGQLPFIPADKIPCPPDEDARNWFSRPFENLGKVRIEPESTLWMQSSSDLEGTEWDREFLVADVPVTGAGNLVVTNGVPGYGLSLTFVNGENAATGKFSVAPSSDPTFAFFDDGANWAGTVVADGRVSVTNTVDPSAPGIVRFGAVEFNGDFPLRVWKTGCDFVSDKVDGIASISGVGGFKPIPQNGFRFTQGDTFVIGKWAASAVPEDLTSGMAYKWKMAVTPSDEEGYVLVSARYSPPGTVVVFR